jgi:hypothetical protein
MDLVLDFNSIKSNLYLLYINNLIKTCEKNNINKDILMKELEKADTLNKEQIIINKEKNKSSNSLTNTDSPTTTKFSDDYLYQKPWNKLTAIHKIIKVKEYVNQLLIENEKDKQKIKESLIELVKNKTLTKKDSVTYDSNKFKIISIPILKFENGKYII